MRATRKNVIQLMITLTAMESAIFRKYCAGNGLDPQEVSAVLAKMYAQLNVKKAK